MPDPSEWHASLSKAQVSLAQGQSTQLILNVSTGCGCQEGSVATIRVTGQSVNAPDIMDYVDTHTTRGPEVGVVELEFPDMLLFSELRAGQELSFNLTVKNPQHSKQAYKLSHTYKPADWRLSYSNSKFEVETLSKIDIDIFLKLPDENNPGKYKLGFKVESVYDPYVQDTVELELALLPELAIKKITPAISNPKAGEKVNFQIILENLGPATARMVQVNLYDHLDMSINHLIGQQTVEKILGNTETTLSFNWTASKVQIFNITAHADPENLIEEVGNRYFNNIKTIKLTVVLAKPNGSDDGKKNNDGATNSDIQQLLSEPISIFLIVLCVVIFVILILIFLFRSRRRRFEDEKTAKKIPLGRGSSGRVSNRSRNSDGLHHQKKGNYQKRYRSKKAKKIQLRESKRKRNN